MSTQSGDQNSLDCVALGEVMLRLDPGDGRVRTARQFRVWEGGGEYNVARGLSRVFGCRTAVVTALADNEIGRLVEDLIYQGGVGREFIKWKTYDGIGRATRNGLNFTERGFGVRGAIGVSDRGHTAVSQLAPGDIDWTDVFGRSRTRWFHTGGILAGLSSTTAALALEAVQAAKEHGVTVSYDLNYRPSLWKAVGGRDEAVRVNRCIAPYVDVMIGNEEDFTAALGFDVAAVDQSLTELDPTGFGHMIEDVAATYPGIRVIATTLRGVRTATINDWTAIGWSPETGLLQAAKRPSLEIYDRVGGGDSFASGLIWGLLKDRSLQEALELGAAHGALAMTTPGDTSMASLNEVEALAGGGTQRVSR